MKQLLGRVPYIRWSITDHDVEIALNVMKELGIEHLADKRVTKIGGGEWRGVLLARAFIQEPKVLLLDEPSSHLNLNHRLDVLKLIRNVTKRKRLCTVIALHGINLALRYSGKVILLNKDVILFCGLPNDLKPELIEKIYGVKVGEFRMVKENYSSFQ